MTKCGCEYLPPPTVACVHVDGVLVRLSFTEGHAPYDHLVYVDSRPIRRLYLGEDETEARRVFAQATGGAI